MPLRKSNTRHFYRTLYGGELKTLRLLKRNDDQQQGTVRELVIFNCRRGPIQKTGETLQGDETSDQRTTLHVPVAELNRVGVAYLSSLDRFVETTDDGGMPLSPHRYWQAEATTQIEVKVFENWVTLDVLRTDPYPPEG